MTDHLLAEGKKLAKLRSEIGMVSQSFNLFAEKTILENVMLGPLKVRKDKKSDVEQRARLLLKAARLALPELMQRGVNDLSANYGNVVAAGIVVAAIYICINTALTKTAEYLDRRSQRGRKTKDSEPAFEFTEPQG